MFKVISNEKRKALSERASPGIQPELAKLCAARELFKYASYLDGCFIAQQRVEILVNNPRMAGILPNETSNTYKVVQEIIKEKISEVSQRDRALNRWEKGLLHAVWMAAQCKDGYAMLSDIEIDDTMEFPKTFFWQPRTIEFFSAG